MQATGTTASPLKPTKSTVGATERPESSETEERRSIISLALPQKQTTSQVQNRSSTTAPSPHGRCTQPFQPACPWVRPTVRFGVHQPPPSHKQTSPSTPTTRAGPPPSCSTWASILRHRVRSSTSQRTTRSQTTPRFTSYLSSSTKPPETAQRGMWPTSTAALATVTQDITWKSLLAIPSTSRPTTESRAMNCGRTTPRTIRHGELLIFSAAVAKVGQEPTCTFLLATPSISQPMMETPAMNCGLTTPPITQHGE